MVWLQCQVCAEGQRSPPALSSKHSAPCCGASQVSASSGQGVKALFQTLFARILATVAGMPEELAVLATQQANSAREEG